MVRIMIKGGVWKNTEDEILKAAVMKYGKNQWARISSLLVRKTPKQCKARWYEWIDPSIRKTEWTRDEEEKLLHLAKIMPTQWRTIAPMIGRTAAQCLEHYERLLDAAQDREGGASASGSGSGAAGGAPEQKDERDDPRRLKPGEIDPLPEAKPARPDPVDMDEDEKEMLSEARARLANVKGKKAKRKAREKQLEEARRLAALQKKRELKAAGIELATKKRKKKHGMDYNTEIPFARAPVPGFYDTSVEKQMTERAAKDVKKFVGKTLAELDHRNKDSRDDAEEKLRKKDAEKQKLQKKVNLPAQLVAANKLNDPAQFTRRSKLIMPAPQMSEDELETIQRSTLGAGAVGAAAAAALASGSSATKALLGQFAGSQTPALGGGAGAGAGGATPFAGGRTPLAARTPLQRDNVLLEAQNLIALTTARTPLAGGENTPLNVSDFSGVTPKRSAAQTPNVLATPVRGPGGMGVGATPLRSGSGASGVGATPIRDTLGINAAGEEGTGMDAQSALAAMAARKTAAAAAANRRPQQTAVQKKVVSSLLDLPAPQHEYQFQMPVLPPKPDAAAAGSASELVEDAEDAANRVISEAAAKRDEELRRRSQVLQRDLPRPRAINFAMFDAQPSSSSSAAAASSSSSSHADAELAAAQRAISDEMLRLLRHDHAKYPVPGATDTDDCDDEGEGGTTKRRKVLRLETFARSELDAAKRLIAAETDARSGAALAYLRRHSDALSRVWERTHADYQYLPSQRTYGHASAATDVEQLQALRQQFAAVRGELAGEAVRAKALETKVEVLTAGYQMRTTKLTAAIADAHSAFAEADAELQCFTALSATETPALQQRLNALNGDLAVAAQKEQALQARYAALAEEHQQLIALVTARANTATATAARA